jgi:F420-non-reducing hydrogenase iron-sulfur subunit
MRVVQYLLERSGIGADRLCLRWVSAAEGQQFAAYVQEYSEKVLRLGAFSPEAFDLSLAALDKTLGSPRLRWLMGMELKITEKGNIYGEKLEEHVYEKVLRDAAQEEYEKALVWAALRTKPGTVRDIALETGLAVYTVSCRLNDLERSREAELCGYRTTSPEFRCVGL